MKKIIIHVLFAIYVVIAVFVTVCLLSYNEFKITEFGDSSLIIIDSNEVEPDFQKGDLVIANKNDKINVGDNVFFYNTYQKEVEVAIGKVTNLEKITSSETTYTISGEEEILLSSEYIIGTAEDATKIPNVGTILGILESKWGFLFLIVFPSLIAFLYEIGVVVSEIKDAKKEEGK